MKFLGDPQAKARHVNSEGNVSINTVEPQVQL